VADAANNLEVEKNLGGCPFDVRRLEKFFSPSRRGEEERAGPDIFLREEEVFLRLDRRRRRRHLSVGPRQIRFSLFALRQQEQARGGEEVAAAATRDTPSPSL